MEESKRWLLKLHSGEKRKQQLKEGNFEGSRDEQNGSF